MSYSPWNDADGYCLFVSHLTTLQTVYICKRDFAHNLHLPFYHILIEFCRRFCFKGSFIVQLQSAPKVTNYFVEKIFY